MERKRDTFREIDRGTSREGERKREGEKKRGGIKIMTEVILPVNIIIHAAPFFHSLFSLLDFIFSPVTKSSLFL